MITSEFQLPPFRKGDSVRINAGPFEGFKGIIDQILLDKEIARVFVTIFDRLTPLDLEFRQLEKLGTS